MGTPIKLTTPRTSKVFVELILEFGFKIPKLPAKEVNNTNETKFIYIRHLIVQTGENNLALNRYSKTMQHTTMFFFTFNMNTYQNFVLSFFGPLSLYLCDLFTF